MRSSNDNGRSQGRNDQFRRHLYDPFGQGMAGLLAGPKSYSETGQPVEAPEQMNTAAVAVPA